MAATPSASTASSSCAFVSAVFYSDQHRFPLPRSRPPFPCARSSPSTPRSSMHVFVPAHARTPSGLRCSFPSLLAAARRQGRLRHTRTRRQELRPRPCPPPPRALLWPPPRLAVSDVQQPRRTARAAAHGRHMHACADLLFVLVFFTEQAAPRPARQDLHLHVVDYPGHLSSPTPAAPLPPFPRRRAPPGICFFSDRITKWCGEIRQVLRMSLDKL
nr:uncharacterized protein LOC127307434 [Lolium perenne]XP_051194119.1 uncharacterized protein LOC127307435 [Lolium perenne]